VRASLANVCHVSEPDPDAVLAGTGFAIERHTVHARGATLTVFRLVRASPGDDSSSPGDDSSAARRPVLLQHGLFDSAMTWLANGRDGSLALRLAGAGRDVWLANSRGNWWGVPASSSGWKFSWDEMASEDLPATVALVRAVTRSAAVDLVAHSQGAALSLAALAGAAPRLADSLGRFVALAPPLAPAMGRSVTMKVLARTHADKLLGLLGRVTCAIDVIGAAVRTPAGPAVLNDLFGPPVHPGLYDARRNRWVAQFPAPTSGVNVAHWVRVFRDRSFESRTGRAYPLRAAFAGLRGRIAVFVGAADALSTVADARAIAAEAGLAAGTVRVVPRFAHMDFTWAPEAAAAVYGDVEAFLEA
jgi:pimeloyl-ACP methyl ester carboxylesterase